jgi:hypothetical protein
MFAP